MPSGPAPGPGVYVHVPFCATRCDYCAFATWTDRDHLIDAYVDACVLDVERWVADGLAGVATVYVGGGTPSLLPARSLARILDAIPRRADAEVTVEANPDSVDAAKLRIYRDHGVTRVSIGVQSTRAHVLAALGRTHDRANVDRAVAAVTDVGFPSFNLDVIAGAAGESDADFDATLADVLALAPPHVSVYGLMVEPGTVLERRVAAGECPAPDPDAQADRYLRADAGLAAAGLGWYEVSNWSRPGHECRHNQGYWSGRACVAIGAAAHGFTDGVRWWNTPRPERYIARIAAGRSPVAGEERPDAAAAALDRFALALRTRGGALRADADPEALGDLRDAGLLDLVGDRIVLRPAGRLLASEITRRLAPGPGRGDGPVGTRYAAVPGRPGGADGQAGDEVTDR